MKIHIINGPNLNLLGVREPEIYGSENFDNYIKILQAKYINVEITYFQSNVEGDLVNEIQRVGFFCDGIILNAAAYSHTSIAIADALSAISSKTIEVHISNIFAREPFRHHSYISSKAVGVICGLGLRGYDLAIEWLIKK